MVFMSLLLLKPHYSRQVVQALHTLLLQEDISVRFKTILYVSELQYNFNLGTMDHAFPLGRYLARGVNINHFQVLSVYPHDLSSLQQPTRSRTTETTADSILEIAKLRPTLFINTSKEIQTLN